MRQVIDSPDVWAAVDRYIYELVVQPDPVLDGALAAIGGAGLPSISVSPAPAAVDRTWARPIISHRCLR
jgi:hypothetical protein